MRQLIFKNVMKQYKPLMSVVLLGTLCLIASCNRDDLSNRKYVATVNGERIFLDEYETRLNAQKGIFSPKAFPNSLNKRKLLEEEILESMITEKIILQRAREMNLSVSNTELEKKLLDIRKDYGDNFFDLLISQNVRYDDWREEIKKEMLLDKLVSMDVNASVRVAEDEAEDYFNKHQDLCKTEVRVRVSQIVVRDPGKAHKIKDRLENGEDFAQVAAQESIGPEAVRGGDLGLIFHQTMPEPLDKTLFNLPVDKISPIAKSAYGYHIFKVTEKQPARTRSFSECKEEIMVRIRTQKEDAAFTVWLEGLKHKAVVKKNTQIFREKTQKK
ncbi:MAG: peptidyl-prolyl cis-trans isomerase [Smithellaceae bacterium]